MYLKKTDIFCLFLKIYCLPNWPINVTCKETSNVLTTFTTFSLNKLTNFSLNNCNLNMKLIIFFIFEFQCKWDLCFCELLRMFQMWNCMVLAGINDYK